MVMLNMVLAIIMDVYAEAAKKGTTTENFTQLLGWIKMYLRSKFFGSINLGYLQGYGFLVRVHRKNQSSEQFRTIWYPMVLWAEWDGCFVLHIPLKVTVGYQSGLQIKGKKIVVPLWEGCLYKKMYLGFVHPGSYIEGKGNHSRVDKRYFVWNGLFNHQLL